jgi:phosphate-selective porin OprO and OprP
MVINSTDDIINALIAKGVLTEEEGALLQKGRTGEKEAAEKKKKEGVSTKIKDGAISLESGDGNNSIALTGRMHFDIRGVDADNNESNYNESDRDTKTLGDNFEVRRARIGAKGKFLKDFSYEVVGNLVGSSTNTLDVAYVNWGRYEPFQIRAGQFKQPFNLEELTSSNNIDFMERSYVNQITPAKKPGVMVHGVPTKGLTYAGSVYQQNNWGEESQNSDGKSFAGRATLNFAEMAGWKDAVFHVGAAGFNSEYDILPTTSGNTFKAAEDKTRGTVFNFRSGGRGLATAYRAQIAGDVIGGSAYGAPANYTAQIDNRAYGLELAAAYGPFKFQSEYTGQTFDAKHDATGNKLKADVSAWYVEALWMLTGENYSDWYKNGGWGAIKPKSNFDLETGTGKGAWELGLRYDEFNVSDTSYSGSSSSRFQGATDNVGSSGNTCTASTTSNTLASPTGNDCGGGAKSYTAGLKWVLNPNMRMMLNYTHTKYDNSFKAIDVEGAQLNDKEDLLMLRTQVAF